MDNGSKQRRTMSRSKTDQMVATLRDEIITSQWKVGDFLPSEIALSEQYRLSPNTVRKGLDVLVSEGYIEKVPRIGARVISPVSPDQITIRFGYLSDMLDYELPIHDVVHDFQNQHPNISIQPVGISARRGGSGGWEQFDNLDVMEIVSLADYVEKKKQFLEPVELKDGFYPFLAEPFSTDGITYAHPYTFTPTILCYNKEHFREKKMPEPDSSWTWDDLIQAGLHLSEGKDRYGLYFHATRELRWLPFLLQSGFVFERDHAGKYNLHDPRLIKSMQCIYELINNQALFPPFMGEDEQDEQALFVREKVSMLITTYDRLFTFQDASFEYDISPLPILDKPRTLLNTIALATNRSSQNKVAARLFTDYLLSYEMQSKIRLCTTRIPALTLAAEWRGEGTSLKFPSRYHMYREIIPTFRYHTALNLPYSKLTVFRNEMKYYWSGLEDLDTVLKRLTELL